MIALKQEVFTSMVFMLLWRHDDNRNGSLPPWKDSALCPILRVTVCLPVPIFMPIWSIAKVEWDWFCHSRGIFQPGKNVQEKPFILLQNIQEIVLVFAGSFSSFLDLVFALFCWGFLFGFGLVVFVCSVLVLVGLFFVLLFVFVVVFVFFQCANTVPKVFYICCRGTFFFL